MKVAILGMGNMGSKYAEYIALNKVDGMELSAVTRIRQQRIDKLKNILPSNLPIFESSDKLYDAIDNGSIEVDAVIIATPHYSHEELTIKAFERGLNVLCDKPAGVYSRQGRNMLNAKRENTVYGFVFHQRTYPVHIRLKEIVDSGKYGKIRRVNWIATDWYRSNAYYNSEAWRATWKSDGGGTLLNQCPHNLDLLQWICGMPIKVSGFCHEGKYHNIEVEDDVTAYFEWENGATGVFIASTGEAAGVNRFEITMDNALIVLEKGKLRIFELDKPESEYLNSTGDMFAKPTGVWNDIEIEDCENAYITLLNNFANAVQNGQELIADGIEARKSLILSNAVYLSSWENKAIEIPKLDSKQELVFEKSFEEYLCKKCK